MKFIFLALFFLISCGESPLFNHELEKNGLVQRTDSVELEGISFPNANFTFLIDWKTGPVLGEGQLILKTWKTAEGTFNGPYVDLPYDLKVVLWMPAMGHGSSPTKITRLDSGEYDVSNIYFIMGGKWELKVQLYKDGNLFDEVVLSYNL